jgi:hypothetical protein
VKFGSIGQEVLEFFFYFYLTKSKLELPQAAMLFDQ